MPPKSSLESSKLRFLLMQVRDADDPMRQQEVECFARGLDCQKDQITTCDLLAGVPNHYVLDSADMVLIGGSGDYSVVAGGPWLEPALATMRLLHDIAKPTFASCWGFQAMARAMGGRVVTDLGRAEVGTHELTLTEAGMTDSLFRSLGETFDAQQGHQDIVDELPTGAILLASSQRVRNQAYRFPDCPIYATQFHPELNIEGLLTRVRRYPQYIERIVGIPYADFESRCHATPQTDLLLKRFKEQLLTAPRL